MRSSQILWCYWIFTEGDGFGKSGPRWPQLKREPLFSEKYPRRELRENKLNERGFESLSCLQSRGQELRGYMNKQIYQLLSQRLEHFIYTQQF